MPNMICVILAGGRSRRMGQDKALLKMGNETFLAHLIDLYSPDYPVYVSLAEPESFPHPGAEEIVDLRPGRGPLAGLESSFVRTGADLVFLTATDLPFGDPGLADTLIRSIGAHDACVILRSSGSLEPLFAAYSSSCLPVIRDLLDRDLLSVKKLLDRIDVLFIRESDLEGYDLNRILWNINSPDDYREAVAALS